MYSEDGQLEGRCTFITLPPSLPHLDHDDIEIDDEVQGNDEPDFLGDFLRFGSSQEMVTERGEVNEMSINTDRNIQTRYI